MKVTGTVEGASWLPAAAARGAAATPRRMQPLGRAARLCAGRAAEMRAASMASSLCCGELRGAARFERVCVR